jgi:hypothetical protein
MAIPRNPSNSGIREDEVESEEVAEVDISNFSLASVATRVMVASSPTSS